MSDSVIRSRIDPTIKNEANKLLQTMGLTMSEAIRLFLHRIILDKALPFPIEIPNRITVNAMKDADVGKGEVTTIEQISKDWDSAICDK